MVNSTAFENSFTVSTRDAARLFRIVLLFFVLEASLGVSLYFIKPSQETSDFFSRLSPERMAKLVIVNKQKPKPAPVIARPKLAAPKEPEKKIFDLTNKPLLNQKKDIVVKTVTRTAVVRPASGIPRLNLAVLGTGGGLGNAVRFGKVGNQESYAIAQNEDTLTVSTDTLKGTLVSVSTVTSAPVLVTEVKPAYTPEMIEHRVAGLVRAKILVDVDGTVNKIIMLEDVGYGSRETAFEAFKKLKFKPAMRGNEAVAVWIIMKYRFVLQN